MFYKICSVTPLTGYTLLVRFECGEKKIYDVGRLFEKWEAFKALSLTKGLFELVMVDKGGYGVSWNDEIDLSCDELYHGGMSVPEEAAG